MSNNPLSLDDLCGRMQLAEEDEGGLCIDDTVAEGQTQDLRWCLVGRFLTDRQVNFLAMKNTLASVWRPVKGVFIKELGPNLFLFQFFHELDITRVQLNGPWTFDSLLLITKRLNVGEQPSRVELFHTDLWVQVYDLPFGFMTEMIGTSIGNFIGTYLDSDEHNFSGVWQNYMRIRVSIDVRSPLKRRMKLKKAGGDWVWVNFKYDRLPTFCFYCGFIGHSDKFCDKLFNAPTVPEDRAYGSWMRAPSRRQTNQAVSPWLRWSFPSKNSVEQNKEDDSFSADDDVAKHGDNYPGNKWLWSGNKKGIYTVKSGYRMLCSRLDDQFNFATDFDWKGLWGLKVPAKVKNVVWRACHNSLPTKERLLSRQVQIQSLCPVCNMSLETVAHAFFYCSFAKRCWSILSVNVAFPEPLSFLACLNNIWETATTELKCKICMMIWSLWKNRNDIVWNQTFMSPTQVVNLLSAVMFQWQAAQVCEISDWYLTSADGVSTWSKPSSGSFKCNVDAALFHETSLLGFGSVIRDCHGSFVAAIHGSMKGPIQPEIAEAMSMREALRWLQQSWLTSSICLETDSLVVVKALRGKVIENSFFLDIINECKGLLSGMSNVSCVFVRRSANGVAHLLARATNSMSGVQEWRFVPPLFICNALQFDLL